MENNENYIKGCKELEYKNYKTAINYFSKAIVQNPNDLQSLIKRADTYMEIEDHKNYFKDLFLQSKLYTKKLNENRNNYIAYCKRGNVYHYLDRNTQAKADYEKAIKLNPKYVEAYIGLGYVKMHQGKDELIQALNVFLQAISLQPDNSQALYNVGLIYSQQKDTEKAIEYYKKSIETKGDYSAVSYRSLGRLYSKMKRYDEAIAYSKEFLRHNSGYDNDYRNLAFLYEKIGDLNEAIFHINTAITIDNSNPFIYFDLSKLYVKSGNFEMALENVNRAISIENRRSFLQHKAKLLLKLDKTEEAEKTFDEIWKNWQLDYSKLIKLALRNGIGYDEINSI